MRGYCHVMGARRVSAHVTPPLSRRLNIFVSCRIVDKNVWERDTSEIIRLYDILVKS